MVEFVGTFYKWAAGLDKATAYSLGKVGLSFDVEHMAPSATKEALQKAQALKSTTKFASGNILVQHTIEGKPNPDGTDYVMRYADSGLIMLYRNYMHSSQFSDDSNILSRAQYMLKDQCIHCLDDAYATANYQAKLTIMVEASCHPADYCGKISFCAHDDKGADYAWNTLQTMESELISGGTVSQAQFGRLFNPSTTYAIHDWGWFRCYDPISETLSYPQCATYHQMAAQCRATLGPVNP
jgi:hypothetical protein